jgi:hypothetical protein
MRLRLSAGAVAAVLLLGAVPTPEARRWWAHVEFLAGDALEGRQTGSEGHRKAAEYVATQFRHAGLAPAGVNGWFQPVPFRTRRLVEEQSSMTLVRGEKTEAVKLGDDAMVSLRIDPAPSVDAPLVFAGYGLTVPESHHNDLAGLDLRGAIVVLLNGAPKDMPGPLAAHYQSSERYQFLRRAGAIGMVAIPNPRHMDLPWARMAAARLLPSMSLADAALDESRALQLSAVWNPARAGQLFAGTGHTLEEIVELAEAGKPLPRFSLHARLRARARVERDTAESQNVAGVLAGSNAALKGEYVVLSAHIDHLGKGYPGAMDDASGIATLIEVARALHDSHAALRRSVLFLAVTAEEKGLLGSRYFAAHPTVERAGMVADLNVDMYLPLFPFRSVVVYGLKESDLAADAEAAAGGLGVRVENDPEPERNIFIRSDQYSFIRQGIPSMTFKVGYEKGTPQEQVAKAWLKERYHAAADDVKQSVDFDCALRFNQFIARMAEAVANRPTQPAWRADSFFRRFQK